MFGTSEAEAGGSGWQRQGQGGPQTVPFEKMAEATSKLLGVFDKLIVSVTKFLPDLSKFAPIFNKLEVALAPVNKMLSSMGEISNKVVAPFKAFSDGLSQAAKPMLEFVEAIDPTLVNLFGLAMRDLNAVIGQAFGPALMEIIELIQHMAASFKPLMAALAPLFGELFDALTDVITMLMSAFIPVWDAMASVLEVYMEMVRGYITLLTPFFVILKAALAVIAPVLKGLATALVPVIQLFTRALTLATAGLMYLFGATGMMKQLAKDLDPDTDAKKEKLQGFAAVKNVQFTDAASYGRKILTSAASAGLRGDSKKSSDEWLKKLSEDINKMSEGNFKAFEDLKDDVLKALEELGNKIVAGAKGEIWKTAQSFGTGAAKRAFTPLYSALEDIRWLTGM